MNEHLLGYLLNALDPETHRQVDGYVKSNPEARQRLELLRQAAKPLAVDRDECEPSRDLVIGTLARVAEHCCRTLPHAPMAAATRTVAAQRPFWRRADVLVAAALLITVLGFTIPWFLKVRQQALITECQANLKKFYDALKVYSEKHGDRFPNIATAAKPPRNVAGLVVPILSDAQTLPDDVSVRCPANGSAMRVTWTVQDLEQMDPAQFDLLKAKLVSCYAYSLGYRTEDAVVLSLDYDPGQKGSVPIMADGPPRDAWAGNSSNHGGKGQNVLYVDGSVKFCTTRTAGLEGDDIYVNFKGKIAPGLSWKDTVLASSEVNPP